MQISGKLQLEHEDSKHKHKSHAIWMSVKTAGSSPRGLSWRGICEGKEGRKVISIRAGLYLSSKGNVRSAEKVHKAAQALEHRSIKHRRIRAHKQG